MRYLFLAFCLMFVCSIQSDAQTLLERDSLANTVDFKNRIKAALLAEAVVQLNGVDSTYHVLASLRYRDNDNQKVIQRYANAVAQFVTSLSPTDTQVENLTRQAFILEDKAIQIMKGQ